MKRSLVLFALPIAACSGPAATPEPEEPEDAVPSVPAGYTDAEQTAILAESIELVYGSDPQPEWYPAFIELVVEDRWAYVATTLTDADAALVETMCRDIAAITFDDNAEPIGVTDVLIGGAGNVDLFDCDVPAG